MPSCGLASISLLLCRLCSAGCAPAVLQPPIPPVPLSLYPSIPTPQVGAGGQSLREQQLTDRLLQLLSGVEAAAEPLTVDRALAQPPPQLANDDSRLPLTW